MTAARSSSVTRRGTIDGGGSGGGASRKAPRRAPRRGVAASSGGPSSGRAPALAEAVGGRGLAMEELPAELEARPQVAAGVTEAAVEQEPLAERLLGVGTLLERDRDEPAGAAGSPGS